jgi:drug/metabolite transporter (DMT)-like permease
MSLFHKIRSLPIYQAIESLSLFNRVPLHNSLGLSIAIILDTGVQIFWKMATLATEHQPFLMTFVHPLFFLVVVLFLLQLANWLKVLEHADLSYSQPITSLSYISVGLISAAIPELHEKPQFLQVIGICFVLAGVWFISKTEHNTLHANGNVDNQTDLPRKTGATQ